LVEITRKHRWWIYAAIFAMTFAVYSPTWHSGFIWNDGDYVTDPELRDLSGLVQIWTEPGATEQYYPVLHTAFWIEYHLIGDKAGGYHLINILLHAAAACLFGMVLFRLDVKGGWIAAALFAVHPVCVESVAWISEQKNTLSLCFYLAAALVWLRYEANRRTSDYAVATALFTLAILSKSVTATLPAALLVVAWWRRGTISWRCDVVPLLPWFLLGAAGGLFTAWVEHTHVGARGERFEMEFLQRGLLAGRAIWFYAGKLIWPANLIFIYPRWSLNPSNIFQYLYPLAAGGMIVVLYRLRAWSRAPLTVALLFIGGLFPVLGFFNVYAFVFSFVADHFQYLPCLALIALAGAALKSGVDRLPRWSGAALIAILLGVLGTKSRLQCAMYGDLLTFYRTIISQNPNAWMPHTNLGCFLLNTGETTEALEHLQRAQKLQPNNAEIEGSLGVAFAQLGRAEEALVYYENALRLDPKYYAAHYNLANLLLSSGHADEALPHFKQALPIRTRAPEILEKMGAILLQRDQYSEALDCYQKLAKLRPNRPDVYNNLGLTLNGLNRLDEALACFDRALELKPDGADIHFNAGLVCGQNGRLDRAIVHLENAVRLKPDYGEAHLALATILEEKGRTQEAAVHRELGLRLTSPQNQTPNH
jgi:tetratricopeptide (TPR) repeat protein